MEIYAALSWAFIASYISIRLAKPIAYRTGLVDKPNERKFHSGAIPLVGGISIFIGVFTAIKVFYQSNEVVDLYLLSSTIILLLGVLDDKHDLKVSYRITVQAVSACIMVFGADMYISEIGNIIGIGQVSFGYFGILVTVVAVIGAINAFNMIDGIDGLAGMISIVTFASLAFLLGYKENPYWSLPVLFIFSILAYLMFNLGWPIRKLKKIFMGDAGSMLIGLTIVWLLVIGSQGDDVAFKPVTALWIIALPLMDMTAIMLRRIRKGQSPFKPDRDHLHHICMRAGLSPRQALMFITSVASLLVTFGILGELANIPEWIMFSLFIILFLFYDRSLKNIWKIVSWFRKTRQTIN